MSRKETRVGVYVCDCGVNIAAIVDVEAVRAFAAHLDEVVVARHYQSMCAEQGQEMIGNDIRRLGINRVVVASCSPHMHETTFKKALANAGLNPYYLEIANIREQCSWITGDSAKATEKAKRLVRGAVDRVIWHEPLESREVPVNPSALVVGGGIAGIQAALTIADSGYHVYLVEREPSIGGRMAQLDKTFPTMDCSACILTPKMVSVGHHPNITLLSYSEVVGVWGYVGNFRVKVKKKPRYIDPKVCTGCNECTRVCTVEVPSEFDMGQGKRKAVYWPFAQAVPNAFVIDKKQSPCKLACPAGIKVQGYIDLIAQGKFRQALELIREEIPFASVCGRVCPRPCENECRRKGLDEPIAIAALKRFVADNVASDKPPAAILETKKEKVAIIGSGPAGLAAAYDLVRMGYHTTVFEASPIAGGMLALGIPDYRLPREVLQKEIDYIKALGVDIRTDTPIGDATTLPELFRQGYGAVFVAIGAQQGRRLSIPGMEMKGVLIGLSFLRDVKLGRKVSLGHHVLVLGGGDVAFGCARTALRLGAREVHIACLESRETMPASPAEIKEGEEEGIIIHPSLTFTRIIGEGRVSAVECSDVLWTMFDEEGNPNLELIPESGHLLPTDTVIFAIGQTVDLSALSGVEGLEITRQGTIAVEPETLATSVPGIFAGGDALNASGSVIEAIACGKKAAVSIDRYLRGQDLEKGRVSEIIKATDMPVTLPPGPCQTQVMPVLPANERVNDFKEVALGFTQEMAVAEAERCLRCAVCSECRQCETVCLPRCIHHDMGEEELELEVGTILIATGHDFFQASLLPQYNYGRFPNVIESMEFERLSSASGPTGGKILLADGTAPESVAIIHCVGSRDVRANSYCSRVCCMHAMKQAHLVKEKTGAQVYNLYIDIRASGKGYEEFYERVQREGVFFIRGRGAEVVMQDGQLVVRAEDTGLGRPITLPVSLVILSTGMTPRRDSEAVARVFHITRDQYGFFMEDHPKLRPFHSNTDGIFLAGTCQAPRDIPDSIAHANAAAAEALSLLSRGKVTIEPLVARVIPQRCSGCLVCIVTCPYKAISLDSGKTKVAEINEVLCKGCGACVAACPSGAITAGNFTDQQILAQVEGILATEPAGRTGDASQF